MLGIASPTVVEFRQYTLVPGQRDVLIDIFTRETIEPQEALGMSILGAFRDLDNPDRFVWIRGFADMAARGEALQAFYGGPVWKAIREAANATMIDSDNVLLLHEEQPGSGLTPGELAKGFVVAGIHYFEVIVDPGDIETQLKNAGIDVLATYVSETSANNFPRLPVRENDRVFVWFAAFPDQASWEKNVANLDQEILGREVLRLQPVS